jgi:hypothetical protein
MTSPFERSKKFVVYFFLLFSFLAFFSWFLLQTQKNILIRSFYQLDGNFFFSMNLRTGVKVSD